MSNRTIGINIDIDLSKIPKNKIRNGKYLNMSSFIRLDELGRFGHNGFIKPQGEKGEELPIIGNTGVFWVDNIENVKLAENGKAKDSIKEAFPDAVEVTDNSDIPF